MRHRPGLGAALALAAACATACTSGSGDRATTAPSNSSDPSRLAATSAPAGTRWWSDAAGPSGAPVDAKNPAAAAERLTPSRSGYCAVLVATVRAGRGLTPASADPSVASTTRAFVAEVQRLAPAEIAPAWRVLGPAIVAVSSPRRSADAAPSPESAQALRRAVSAVARDAKARCSVDLSS